MKFIDSIEISIEGGAGGPGMISFMRGKGKPKLGPDGGNGGRGGDVVFLGQKGINTLYHLRRGEFYKADNGGKGGTQNCTGKTGDSKTIPVPLGTVIYDAVDGRLLGEITKDNEELIVAKGGKRGYGNLSYTNSTRQTPQVSSGGEKGEKKSVKLELKLIAQVGFAGFPNAGKSTLLSVISDARPKIADYPFTTLTPILGVADLAKYGKIPGETLVFADVPGLVEGASEGRGLGHQFLKHLERTRLIVYVIALDEERESKEFYGDYEKLQLELSHYSSLLAKKPAMVVLTKADLVSEEVATNHKQYFLDKGLGTQVVSAAVNQGLVPMVREICTWVEKVDKAEQVEQELQQELYELQKIEQAKNDEYYDDYDTQRREPS